MFGAVCLADGIMVSAVKSVLDEVLSLRPANIAWVDACVWNAKCIVRDEVFDWFLGVMVVIVITIFCVGCCFWKRECFVVFLVEAERGVIVDLVDAKV